MLRMLRLAVLVCAALTGGVASSWGAANPGPMSMSVNPTHMEPTGSATVTATLTGVTGPNVNCGRTTIQYEIYSDSGKGTILTAWTDLSSGTPVNGVFQATFDGNLFTLAAGQVVSFRAGFTPNPGQSNCVGGTYTGVGFGTTPAADLLIDASSGGVCPNDQTTGVFVAIEQPNGIGTPAPGTTSSWSFNVTITACEHVYDVTAQGGDNGWGTIKGCAAQVDAGPGSTCLVRNANRRNNVWLWTIGTITGNTNLGEMLAGQKATAQVITDGTIKNSPSECGVIKKLNGDWSALYATTPGGPKTKSAYTTYEATIEVTCN